MNLSLTLLVVVVVAAVGSGLMAGLFFTFSNFALRALAKLTPGAGNAAMQSINVTIINPVFLVLFFGTAAASLASAVIAIANRGAPGTGWILAGALLYLAGCMVVTFRCNVPLNDKLAAVDPDAPESAAVWRDYVARWLPWNHLRTGATFAATIAFVVGLALSAS